jgi:NADPH-dependent F420 reductase
MTTVSIIGTGRMGQAISALVTRGGNTPDLIGHQDADKPVVGEIVILAVPYRALEEVIGSRADQLAGRVVVDITNPVNLETFDSLTVAPDGSAAAEVAAALPDSRVLKAFNTTFAATLSSGTVGTEITTVLIAGDDAEAKEQLADVVTAGGMRALDAGSLSRARELEAMGFLQIKLAAAERVSWTGGFAVV